MHPSVTSLTNVNKYAFHLKNINFIIVYETLDNANPLGIEFPTALTLANDAHELKATSNFFLCFCSTQCSKFC